jgi:hypothetical protein
MRKNLNLTEREGEREHGIGESIKNQWSDPQPGL